MSRSLKKGPFIDDHLMRKITKMNSEGNKNLSRLGQEEALYFQI